MLPDDRRLPILNLLADYKEQYPLESETVEQYRQFVLIIPIALSKPIVRSCNRFRPGARFLREESSLTHHGS